MKPYTVFFELYGKKMKTTVFAESRQGAMDAIKNKIIFHRVNESKEDESIAFFEDFFNQLTGKTS